MIPFNKPFIIGKELEYIHDAVQNKNLRGDGQYTHKVHAFLEEKFNCKKALLVHSCTAALEMSAILLDIKAGDEIIMPSYTFVSTANAFVLRGGVPVFVDIRKDTKNIDESLIENAITNKTRAICVVHYAGVPCEMDTILALAKKYNIAVIEDAAQAIASKYKGQYLGTMGDLGCFSFHETKNIIAGEGGALLINNPIYADRAEIIREKGTDRAQFFRKEVDKYTWRDIGSSFLPSDLIAAFLFAQLENMETIQERRLALWQQYNEFFTQNNFSKYIEKPYIPSNCTHNAHMYYIIFKDLETRTKCIDFLKSHEISSVFHYIPLHSAIAGKKYCKVSGTMEITDKISDCLLRLPLYHRLSDADMQQIFKIIQEFFNSIEN